MKKRVILFGGAFDPIHIGHISVANIISNIWITTSICDELWFLPSISNAFVGIDLSTTRKIVDIRHRINMISIAINNTTNKKLKICVHEAESKNKACVYSVVKSIIKKYPENDFSYLIGNDQAISIRSWRNSRHLLKTIPFITVSRAYFGGENTPEWTMCDPHNFVQMPDSIPIIKSSIVRGRIRKNKSIVFDNGDPMLPDYVFDYISKHELYKGGL